MRLLVAAMVCLAFAAGACADTFEEDPTDYLTPLSSQPISSDSGSGGLSSDGEYDITPLPDPIAEAQVCAILREQRGDHYRETIKVLEEIYAEQGLKVDAEMRAEARRQNDAIYDILDRDNDC